MKKDVVNELLSEEQRLTPAAEALRQSLNDVIMDYRLSGEGALHTLARLSAGYIHQLQRAYNNAGASVVVEEDFNTILEVYLTSLDMNDVNDEMKREERLMYN